MDDFSSLSLRTSYNGNSTRQLQLPTEVLAMVVDPLEFDYRTGEVDHNSLHKLCQTSRDLCKIAQPRLFQHFIKTQAQLKETPPPDRFQAQPCNPRSFLRTLIANPDLASSVKEMTLCAWVDERRRSSARIKVLPPGPQLCLNLRNVIDGFPLQQVLKRTLLHEIWKGNEDAEIALLLFLTTNVKSLEVFLPTARSVVPPPLYCFPRPFELVAEAQQATGKTALISSIGEITCLRPGGRFSLYFPEASLIDLFCLSSLKVLNLAGINCLSYDRARWPCQSKTSSIQRLTIRDSSLPAHFIQTMIATCACLESFELIWPLKVS